MSNHTKPTQVFQASNSARWQKVKWASRTLLLLVFVSVFIILIALKNIYAPDISITGKAIKKVLVDSNIKYSEPKIVKDYKGFRSEIDKIWKQGKGIGQHNEQLNLSTNNIFSDSLGIRAAFFVNWSNQSYTSLKKNISKLNLVLPEWFFIDSESDTLITKIDALPYQTIKQSGVKVMPMLTNHDNKSFNAKVLSRILLDKNKQEKLINSIIEQLKKHQFLGVNVDFEELNLPDNKPLALFQQNLYTKLHQAGFLVSQNVSPFNTDYNYTELSKYNDYIFLMAYDEHAEHTAAGPISGQKWIEAAVDELCKQVDPKKVVLNLAAYGYDWSKDTVYSVTYQQALATARESEGEVEFDNNTYNLHFTYYDEKDALHEVHFTDAATNFNCLRFSTEYGLAGTAVWRLGSEDKRLWEFYDKPMTKQFLQPFNFSQLSKVNSYTEPDFIGEGEILDLLASPTDGHIKLELDTAEMLIAEQVYDKLPSTYVVRKFGKSTQKKLVLTFDDGPDEVYTKQILDTLALYKVPAAFFVVGIQAEKNIPLIKRIVQEGHELGNHTFTHPNMAEVSKKRAALEIDATRLLLECITGKNTIMFRAPFNADSDPEKSEEMIPVALSRTRNYLTVNESIDPEDWLYGEVPGYNADSIFKRTVDIFNTHLANGDTGNIILLHDAGGNRKETVKAVGMIIRHFKQLGYSFTTVADLMGKKPEDVMPDVPKNKGYYVLQFNYFLAASGYLLGHLMYALFITFIVLGTCRLLFVLYLANTKKQKNQPIPSHNVQPKVSIIVPAYNEQVNVVKSIHNLLQSNYANYDIVFVNDGSTDDTWQIVQSQFLNHPQVKLINKPNGGKSSALNWGILQSQSEIVICIDADTQLHPDAIYYLVQHFSQPLVAAVAGVVKVGNPVNALTQWQSIEYILSQNLDRKAMASLNAITVVPGAIGAFKKSALLEVGGFLHDTLAEDCDVTVRLLKAGYIIKNEAKAIAITESPETVKQFMKQRFRWSFGILQVFWKHKDVLFNSKYKYLGWIAFPDLFIFKYFIPAFAPIAEIMMVIGLLSDHAEKILWYYLIFTLIDLMVAAWVFVQEKEPLVKLLWIVPQRIVYRWLMIVVLFKSFRRAIKGELQAWGVLKRTGNVKAINTN